SDRFCSFCPHPISLFVSRWAATRRPPRSFPTRRSSDLHTRRGAALTHADHLDLGHDLGNAGGIVRAALRRAADLEDIAPGYTGLAALVEENDVLRRQEDLAGQSANTQDLCPDTIGNRNGPCLTGARERLDRKEELAVGDLAV